MKLKNLFSILLMASVVFAAACKKDDNTNVGLTPKVISTNPASDEADVELNKIVTATFGEEMNGSTISPTTFTLKQGETSIEGRVSYLNEIASFNPSIDLTPNTTYTATLTIIVENLSGMPIANDYVWSFTTGTITAPSVIANEPAEDAIDVALDTELTATFSEMMDPSTINTSNFTLKQGDIDVVGTVSYTGTIATFVPSANLLPDSSYTATVKAGAKNAAGVAIANDYSWSFTTIPSVLDEIAPEINSTDPSNNGTDVGLNKVVNAIFSEQMDSQTITDLTFLVDQAGTPVDGSVSYNGLTASFTPSNLWAEATVYTVTITTGAKDLAGNALAVEKVWEFTTGSNNTPLSPVELGTSGNYVILAKTAINNVPTSAITGDLGLSPAATSYITGFDLVDATGYAESSQVTGKVYAADMVSPTSINLTTAVENMITAYNDAAGRPFPDFLELGTGNIGGLTLTPGLYKWTSTVTLPTDVTISGGADDVFIFQISGDLNMSANVNLTLIGGVQAKNIFWQVAGEALIGTNAHFEGIILSMTRITYQTGASFKGRALAQTAVILDGNIVVGPQ